MKSFLDGSSLCRASYSVTVNGSDQREVLSKISLCKECVNEADNIFPPVFTGASGSYSANGGYSYTLKFSCGFIEP